MAASSNTLSDINTIVVATLVRQITYLNPADINLQDIQYDPISLHNNSAQTAKLLRCTRRVAGWNLCWGIMTAFDRILRPSKQMTGHYVQKGHDCYL